MDKTGDGMHFLSSFFQGDEPERSTRGAPAFDRSAGWRASANRVKTTFIGPADAHAAQARAPGIYLLFKPIRLDPFTYRKRFFSSSRMFVFEYAPTLRRQGE
jgi:hypothetical protein